MAYRIKSIRAWKKLRMSGKYANLDRVALEINAGKQGGKRAITARESKPRKDLAKIKRRIKTQARKARVRKLLKKDER
jgi:hypothetical protein